MGNTQYAMSDQVLRLKFLDALISTGWEMPWKRYSRGDIKLKDDFTGVPTVFFGTPHPLVGAVPAQVYQRAVERLGL